MLLPQSLSKAEEHKAIDLHLYVWLPFDIIL